MTPTKSPHAIKKKYSDKIKLTVGVIVIVAIAITSTILISNNINHPKVTKVRDIGMASDACEERIIEEFEDTLINKNYDDMSSRYEPSKKQYVIYYRVTTRDIEDDLPIIKSQLAKCVILERKGYVTIFEILSI